MDQAGSLALARTFVEALVSGNAVPNRNTTFDATALQGLKVVHVEPGRLIAEMPVRERVQNRYGTLHGGCTATLVDTLTTAALLTVSPLPGVSMVLSVNYVAPMPGTPAPHSAASAAGAASAAASGAAADAAVVAAAITTATAPPAPAAASPAAAPAPPPAAGAPVQGRSCTAAAVAAGSDNAGATAPAARPQHTQQQRRGGSGEGSEPIDAEEEVVVVDARVVKAGRQVATLAAELRRKRTGQLVATGSHTKFVQVQDSAMDRLKQLSSAAKDKVQKAQPPRSRL